MSTNLPPSGNPRISALGAALIDELVARGWTHETFAERADLDEDEVACLLSGRFGALGPDIAGSVARALGVSRLFIERLALAREPNA